MGGGGGMRGSSETQTHTQGERGSHFAQKQRGPVLTMPVAVACAGPSRPAGWLLARRSEQSTRGIGPEAAGMGGHVVLEQVSLASWAALVGCAGARNEVGMEWRSPWITSKVPRVITP